MVSRAVLVFRPVIESKAVTVYRAVALCRAANVSRAILVFRPVIESKAVIVSRAVTLCRAASVSRAILVFRACVTPAGPSPVAAPSASSGTPAADLAAAGLPPLLPYKFIHAQLLADSGRVGDALAYCQERMGITDEWLSQWADEWMDR